MTRTFSELLHQHAKAQNIAEISIWNARQTLRLAKQHKSDAAMARLMLKHGRLTAGARNYIKKVYPECAS